MFAVAVGNGAVVLVLVVVCPDAKVKRLESPIKVACASAIAGDVEAYDAVEDLIADLRKAAWMGSGFN